MSEKNKRTIDWNNLVSLEEAEGILEKDLEKAHEKRGVFTLNYDMLLGRMKSRIAELKGEKRNMAKCKNCGVDIDLDRDFGVFKSEDILKSKEKGFLCFGCAGTEFLGVNIRGDHH